MKFTRVILIHILLPLAVGGLVYLLFRSNSWIHAQLFSPGADLPVIKIHGFLADVLRYNFPDFCWSYALAASMFVWQRWSEYPRKWVTVLALLLLTGSEFIQLVQPGFTFDWKDLVAAILGFGLSYTGIYLHENA
jgi:hypothetical protein